MKDVDLGEPTPLPDHVYFGCTHRECQIRRDIVDNVKSIFEINDFCLGYGKLPETEATGKLDTETISS